MFQKLLAFCICCCALMTRAQIAVPAINHLPLDPDVEILPPASAVSTQYIHRIHNKFIPAVTPFVGVNAAAPFGPLPVAAPPFAVSPLLPATRPLAPIVPTYQPTFLSAYPRPLPASAVIPASLLYPRVLRPSVLTTRLALFPPIARPLRSRLTYARRPVALTLRNRYG